MKITRKQIRQLMRESLIEKKIILSEQSPEYLLQPPEPREEEVDRDIDRDALLDKIAETLWEEALLGVVEEGKMGGWIPEDTSSESIVAELSLEIPPEVEREAGDFLNALEGFAGKSIGEIATDLQTEDIDSLGYYIPMQMLGHGVSWSDSLEGQLDTPSKENIESLVAAEDAIRGMLGLSVPENESVIIPETPDQWDLNR